MSMAEDLAGTTIGFIGGGNMARAIVGGLLRAGHRAERILVADPNPAAREAIRALDPGVRIHDDNAAVCGARVLVLAVKPQVLADVAGALPADRPAGQLVLSIAAGITLAGLRQALGRDGSLVRVMPNQPALVGAGMSVLVAGPGLAPDDRTLAGYVAGAPGKAVWLEDEGLMDAVTAVSGSGPAYFYLLMETMEAAALELGLPAELARTLTRQTALGAARTVVEGGQEPRELRAGVTSPGGTTAAAIGVFEESRLGDIVRRALTAARDRSVELGRHRS
jgi:pyrroline-5-carboxylate reductase